MKPERPENEAERLNALRRYRILDTPPEPAFDRIAEMAANSFRVPMAGISLVDENRIWFKSRVGVDAAQIARDAGLCSSAMLLQGVDYLRDAAHDERSLGLSFVTDLGIGFYAAAPLRTQDGFALGTVWVLDQKPRELASGEPEMLRALAALAMNQIELREYAQQIARLERAQRTIAEGVEAEIGDRFFASLARSLAQTLEVGFAFVSRLSEDGKHFKILAIWERDHFGNDVELPLKGTPCESVLHGQVAHYPAGLRTLFPTDHLLFEWSAESYCGVPVFDEQGRVFGHVAIVDDKHMLEGQRAIEVMRIFAARVRGEVERLRIDAALRETNQRLAQSEKQFRDLFEEAPIAYVHQTVDTNILRANRTAMQILGVKPDEIVGLLGSSFFPDTPEAQQRFRDALPLLATGTDEKGVVLELRRRGDDRPLWVRWWSTPEPGGKYTRSMFLDITEQVLLEQENKRLEERFRDFFEEAPLAYVVGSEAGIIRGNRTAARLFGLKFEEMVGFNWRSLFPDKPEAQRRLREALKLVQSAPEASGTALELRRKDEGRPVWIEWWSKREAGGEYARIMFLDVTDRVRLEQEKAQLEAQNAYLLDEIRTDQNFGDIIGGSSGLKKVMEQVHLVALTDATVLTTGESGTGKELIARAIHERSARRDRTLVRLNCSAVPEGLFESEFFGHVKGAFTGALKDKPGRFELADGGTLFLDEIGEVPLAMQAKLLRVLQEHELERVGDTHTRKVDVRIIAAWKRDLKKEVDEGRFRQDLFYRLSVFPIEVPPLRERRDDIAPLAVHFIKQSARRLNRPEPPLTTSALDQLTSYDWPGNVRELQNTVERAIILWREGPLTFDLPQSRTQEPIVEQTEANVSARLPARHELRRQEREAIVNALRQTNGKVSGPGGAAELLHMKPSTLSSRISSLGINRRTLS